MHLYSTGRKARTGTIKVLLLFLVLLTWAVAGSVAAQQPAQVSAQAERPKDLQLSESLRETLTAERESLGRLRKDLEAAKELERTVTEALDAYRIEFSAHSNLLHLTSTPVSELEKARLLHAESLNGIESRLKSLSKKREEVNRQLDQTQERLAANRAQLQEIRSGDPQGRGSETLIGQLEALTGVLSDKRNLLKSISDVYVTLSGQLEEVKTTYAGLSDQFAKEIENRKVQDLFERKLPPIMELEWQKIGKELKELADRLFQVLTVEYWIQQVETVWRAGGVLLITSILVFVILMYFLYRVRNRCAVLEDHPACKKYPWRRVALSVIRRSLPLLGAIVFIYGNAQIRGLYAQVEVIRIIVRLLTVQLLFKWGSNFLSLYRRENEGVLSWWMLLKVRVLLNAGRAFGFIYVLALWLVNQGVILIGVRTVLELVLFGCSIVFARGFRKNWASTWKEMAGPRWDFMPVLVSACTYAVTAGDVLLELAGYGQLAVFWLASWAWTAAVALWGTLVMLMLREWEQGSVTNPSPESDGPKKPHPVRWFIIRVLWVVWLGAVVIGILFAWGAPLGVLGDFYRVLRHTVKLGALEISLLGLVYALLVLLFTHAASRLWRVALRNRILSDSGLETGLQDSITTITVYVLWGIGVLVALHAVGLNTTSLAVAFGALGIGLGFGLQNIFNNFISGLILLFERPIQVGDVIEMDGVWGTITRINVRSTVIQTFDNASLIIPNSEFISSKVVNWSFKDLRLRRSISVGVAYGSDVELVRETLLELAHADPRVLKYPQPDVLFTGFGDSSLDFLLRIWTTLDVCLVVETELRFAIDRAFRERGVTIPFPQRDVHFYNENGESLGTVAANKTAATASPNVPVEGYPMEERGEEEAEE